MFGKKKFLTRKDILEVQDIKIEEVHVPEWFDNGYVHVKGLTAAEWIAVVKTSEGDGVDKSSLSMELATVAICDKDGKPLFEKKHVAELSEKASAPMERILKVAYRLSGLGSGNAKKLAEDIESDPLDSATG